MDLIVPHEGHWILILSEFLLNNVNILMRISILLVKIDNFGYLSCQILSLAKEQYIKYARRL